MTLRSIQFGVWNRIFFHFSNCDFGIAQFNRDYIMDIVDSSNKTSPSNTFPFSQCLSYTIGRYVFV